jgi:hypothetical protein
MTHHAHLVAAAMLAACVVVGSSATLERTDAFTASRDHPAIQYSTHAVDTSISRLNREIEAGKVHLAFDYASGYLPSLLEALDVPIESQLLVFSATSAQASIIGPNNPRALFFNDVTSIGWVRGAETLEVAARDPRQGMVFYALEQKPVAKPRLTRNDGCLECHLSWDTLGVPGVRTISTFPMLDDKNAYATGVVVDHRTDFEQRWGGWYVTGTAVPVQHLGNLPVVRSKQELARPAPSTPVLQSIAGLFDSSGYVSRTSDVVALMVMEHQAHMSNLLIRLGWEARLAEQQKLSGRPLRNDRVEQAAQDVVDYLLFVDEAPLTRRVVGSSGFTEKFSAQGPKDSRGRSLRQLDLERRLMRYPCSYLIYSTAFDALNAMALDAVYRRLWQVLSGQISGKPYARLSADDRTAVVEILRETKNNLPEFFRR